MAGLIASQACKDPRMQGRQHSQEAPLACMAPPAPHVPPLPRDPVPRRPKPTPATKPPVPEAPPQDRSGILSMRGNSTPEARAALTPRRPLDTQLRSPRASVSKPRDEEGVRCAPTRNGIECRKGESLLSFKEICDSRAMLLPAHLRERCPQKPISLNIDAPYGPFPSHRDSDVILRWLKGGERKAQHSCSASLGNFDITDLLLKRLGFDPYWHEKMEKLDRTRIVARAEVRMRSKERHIVTLNERLTALWQRTNLSIADKKRTLFELWDECVEPDASPEGRKVVALRATIDRFIRTHLPKGSPHAYTPQEIASLNRQRGGKAPFNPYK